MKKIILIAVVLLINCELFAQDTLDSIAKVKQIFYPGDMELKITLIADALKDKDDVDLASFKLSYSEELVQLAESGNMFAQNLLGYYYQVGNGIPADPDKAFYWYSKAAEQGNYVSYLNLGYCYENGVGTETDKFQAYSFYKKAALCGWAEAWVNLAHCYLSGVGTPKNLEKAKAWFKKSAETGLRYSQNNVAVIYFDEGDYENAFYWYGKAAEQGSPVSLFGLGQCYQFGLGTEVDEHKALESYKKAYELGLTEAKQFIDELEK